MKIEKVLPEDAGELLAIYAPYVERTAISFEYTVPSQEEFRERIVSISRQFPYLKAVDGCGRILGYAYASSFHQRAAYDWSAELSIYIRQECRRQGLGRQLYAALEASLKAMGICNVYACIAYTPQDDPHLHNDSIHFHRHMGYEQVATFHRCACKFGTWYSMVYMEKHIAPHNETIPPVTFGRWEIQENTP